MEYLSPSSFKIYREDKERFYLEYVLRDRQLRSQQTVPMAVGSSFDAYVKSYLYEKLVGKSDPKYSFTALFEAQVEVQNRDKALIDGKICFDNYCEQGALADLLLEMNQSVGEPHFEITVQGVLNEHREGISLYNNGVTLLGKPDIYYINRDGAHVIHDWKVNGFYSMASPMKGYVKLRPGGGVHKECMPMMYKGIMINGAQYLEGVNREWADQLSIYGWLLGESIGAEIVISVDQLTFRNGDQRTASHRLRVSGDYQEKLYRELQEAWIVIHSDHFFRDLSLRESKDRCLMLSMRGNLDSDFKKLVS